MLEEFEGDGRLERKKRAARGKRAWRRAATRDSHPIRNSRRGECIDPVPGDIRVTKSNGGVSSPDTGTR